jgi:imidazolonepropionase-like amidohydrolase
MKNYLVSFILCISILGSDTFAQQVGKSVYGDFVLTNATIETITNGTVTGTLIIEDGKITAIGSDVTIPEGMRTIDCTGKQVYPGFIDGGTTLGVSEIGSISLTQDASEIGDLTPQVQALTAVNPSSVLIPVTRVNGITTVLTVPSGGMFPGTAALIDLHGYSPGQMYAGFSGIVLNFPSSSGRRRFGSVDEDEVKKAWEKAMKKLNDTWERVKLFAELDQKSKQHTLDYNPQMEALVPAYKGEQILLVQVNSKKDILEAISWVKKNNIKAVFTGVSEGWRVADSLALAEIPVITGPVLRTPGRTSDSYDIAYRNAGLMQQAGVRVALRTNESENVRNLPYNAGFAAAYGMGREEALKAVTIVPAEIFGVNDRLGSLEVGKSATLFVTDGDPFETKSQVMHLFINGWKVPIESRHTLLYDEFIKREPGLEKK